MILTWDRRTITHTPGSEGGSGAGGGEGQGTCYWVDLVGDGWTLRWKAWTGARVAEGRQAKALGMEGEDWQVKASRWAVVAIATPGWQREGSIMSRPLTPD